MLIKNINEITYIQADLIKSFAIFLLLLIANRVDSSIFTCLQIKYLQDHTWLKLLTAFMLFYFLVTLVSETGKIEFTPPIEKLVYSFFYFIGFLILMRLDLRITGIVLFLIFTIYFLEMNKDFYLYQGSKITNSQEEEVFLSNQYWITFNWPFKIRLFKVTSNDIVNINKIENIIYYIIIFLLIIGFISYGGEIREKFKNNKNITWFDVITNTKICELKDRKSLLHYLKLGLKLNI